MGDSELRDLVKSYIYLNAVLPQLEEVVAFDKEAQELCKGWNCTIQMHCSGGPGVCLIFKDGKCSAKLGTVSLPTIGLYFSSPTKVVNMFEKKGKVVPLPWWGVWHLGILGKFTKLTDLMEKYLKPTEEMLKDRKIFEFHTRMQLMVAAYALKAVGEHDPKVMPIVKKTINGIMEMRVMPDGPAVYIDKQGGTITPTKGLAPEYMVSMQIKGIDLTYDMLTGKVDFMEALGLCKIELHGMIGFAENMAVVLEKIEKYIEP
ncbi:MAG: hypothetical protein WCX65_06825 [bacterium]